MLEPLCRSPNIFLLENSFSMSFPLLFDRRDDPSWCRERLGTPRPDTSKHVARIVLTRAIMNTSSQTSTSPTCVSRAFWESRERERESKRRRGRGEARMCTACSDEKLVGGKRREKRRIRRRSFSPKKASTRFRLFFSFLPFSIFFFLSFLFLLLISF